MSLQSVLIPARYSLAESKEWLIHHGLKTTYQGKEERETKRYHRFRQSLPNYLKYKTKKLPNGVELILGYNI